MRTKLFMMKKVGCLFIVLAVSHFPAGADAQAISTLTVLHNFGISNEPPENLAAPVVQGPDGTLYGTTAQGGINNDGTVFKVQTNGTGLTVLKEFTNSPDGQNPRAGLVLSGGTLYGTTRGGGAYGLGTVFAVNTDGTGFTNLCSFQGWSDGANPQAGLVLSGSTLYGTATGGGTYGNGTVYAINTDGTGFTNLYSLNAGTGDGLFPFAGLVLSGGTLYGTASAGGSGGNGTVFAINTDGTGYTNLYNFSGTVSGTNVDGANPQAALILSGGRLYGTANAGGVGGSGAVFAINADGTGFTNLYSFSPKGYWSLNNYTNSDGANPMGALVLSGGNLYGTTSQGGTNTGAGTMFAIGTNGTGFNVIHTFAGNGDGRTPQAGLMLSGGTLFGTAYYGGNVVGDGSIFSISTNGAGFTTVYDFSPVDMGDPQAEEILFGDSLYGTTRYGGSANDGTIYAVKTNGTGFVTLYSFSALSSNTNIEGANPLTGLVLSGGTLYGTANGGGPNGHGSVFSISTNGTGFTVLRTFGNGAGGGRSPAGGLVISGNTLYGTSNGGTSTGDGAVFSMSTSGANFTVLHNFSSLVNNINSDGANPAADLALSGNMLYGTTVNGGAGGQGTVFSLNVNNQAFTTLHSFTARVSGTNADGAQPNSGLVVSGGTLYGAALYGGMGQGTIFSIATNGTGFTVLHAFNLNNHDPGEPSGDLILSGDTLLGIDMANNVFAINTNGTGYTILYQLNGTTDGAMNGVYLQSGGLVLLGSTLYGTATDKGAGGDGTVFALKPLPIPLNLQSASNSAILSWLNPLLSLQSGPTVIGTYTNIPAAYSPYTNATTVPQQFFRLTAN
jgi:uncharacterized repeat protein (TIGR03803 family)